MTLALLTIAALAQGGGGVWSVWPPRPSVGDTVWLERVVAAPAGWRVRPGRLPTGENYEPLSDPLVVRHASGWLVRYAVVIWSPGTVSLAPPPVWRLGPGGEADSTAGGAVAIAVRSVIPDTLTNPNFQPPLSPLWPEVRRPVAPAIATVVLVVTLLGGIAFRRRPPRKMPAPATPKVPESVGDERWISSGEPRAVAARASAELRAALARAVPAAQPSLSTLEALVIATPELLQAQQRELATVLTSLDQVGFAAVHGVEVRELAKRARALAEEIAP